MRGFLILGLVLAGAWNGVMAQEQLTLDQCIAESLKESESLRSSDAAFDAAQYDANSTFWSFFPTAKVSASYLKLYFEPEPEAPDFSAMPALAPLGAAFSIPEWSRTIDLTVSQPVTPLWSVWKGRGAQTIAADIEKLKRSSTADQIAVKTAEYFYSYLMVERLGTLLSETVKQLDLYQKQAQNFVDAGMTDKRAVLKVKLEKAKIDKEIQNVEGSKLLLRRALALLMNRTMESFELSYGEADFVAANAEIETLFGMQEKNRAELKMLEKLELINDNLTDIAIQPFIPMIALTGGYKHNFDASSMSPEGTFFVGGVLSWEFGFDTMKQYNSFQKVRSEKVKTKLANIDARKQMRLQVTQLYTDLMVKEKEIGIAQASIEAAAENLRIEESKYQEKMTTETDLLAASLQERQAKTSYITAVFQYKIALRKLAGTIGVPVSALTGN
ncbi:MAG TPA: TolC family protein [bacterium]|nr:TolC family protein [bacterium]